MSEARHPNKEINAAVQFAVRSGWELRLSRGHLWGRLKCPDRSRNGHMTMVCSTPKDKDNAAKNIRRDVLKCVHGMEGK